jgi:LacI family transcriptional regulator
MPLVDEIEPPLTTVRIGHVAMGNEAARLLIEQIANPAAKSTIRVTSSGGR